MSEEIEKLIKIQGIINRGLYHLNVHTDLEKEYSWRLYRVFENFEKYMSDDNRPILESGVDSIEDLINYLEKHNGFSRRW